MKVNRIFMLIVSLVAVLTLTACKKEVEVENEVTNNNNVVENISGDENISPEIEASGDIGDELVGQELTEFHGQFKEEIKDYTGYMTNIKLFLESNNNATDYGVSSFLAHLKNSEDPFSSLSYMFKDLNDDGINEFMLFDDTLSDDMKNIIICMSTLSGDLSYNILNSQENMVYRLYENDVIGVEFVDVGCMNFLKLDKDMNLITVDSIDASTSSGDAQNILNKYKEEKLELSKVK